MANENVIAWIHGDNLNPHQPALTEYGDIPAIFVWDDDLLDEWGISFKRIVFMYECLLELPVTIRRGDVAEQVQHFADEHHATRIVTAPSPSPRFRWIKERLEEAGYTVVVLEQPQFVQVHGYIDLKRFSRYWKQVKKQALSPTEKR
jgi:hypothetical protein